MNDLKLSLIHKITRARQFAGNRQTANNTLGLIDLTSLSGDETDEKIKAMCEKAKTNNLASVCFYANHIALAKEQIGSAPVTIATVINFPFGNKASLSDEEATAETTARDVSKAIAMGANQIDIVLPFEEFQNGNVEYATELLTACRAACPQDVRMKVILESAAFDSVKSLQEACKLAIDCGTDSLKTSTGKHEKGGATLEAAAVLLDQAHKATPNIGVKISGGVKTVDDCAQYIDLAKTICGRKYIRPETFRFGASSLVDSLLSVTQPDTKPTGNTPPELEHY